jgi:prepilin-type N-terminal cleavage/methylation domain-containing protein
MLTKIRNKKQENGFSLLELAVAVGIAAIVAAVAVTASTTFVNGSQTKADNYQASANSEITNAKASFDGLYGEAGAPNNEPQEPTSIIFTSADGLTLVQDWDFGMQFYFNDSVVPAAVRAAFDNGSTITVTTTDNKEVVATYTVTYYDNITWMPGSGSFVDIDIANGGGVVSSTDPIANWWEYNGKTWTTSVKID